MDAQRSLEAQLMQRQNLNPAQGLTNPAPQPDRLGGILDQIAKNILGVSLKEAEAMSPDDRERLGITAEKIQKIYQLGGTLAERPAPPPVGGMGQ